MHRKKQKRKGMLGSIPEYDSVSEYDSTPENDATDTQSNGDSLYLQLARFRNLKPENEKDYNGMYWRRTDHSDDELSWFNVSVGV